jgi:hypothetical protein
MKRQEETSYLCRNINLAHPEAKCENSDFMVWREKICYWTYSVIDHFNLSRRTVAISINIFDRYLASKGNGCDGSTALLVSLTTLYIAIKAHERKKIKLSTLVDLSRSQFCARDIENMELEILTSIQWYIHPPTPVDFISYYVKFLPPSVSVPTRHNLFELSRYNVELAVCDTFFVEALPSTIAFSAILNVLDEEISCDMISRSCRQAFLHSLYTTVGLHRDSSFIRVARRRLHSILNSSNSQGHANMKNMDSQPALSLKHRTPAPSSSTFPSDTENMMFADTKKTSCDRKGRVTSLDSQYSKNTESFRSRCSSNDSKGSRCSSQGSAGSKWFKSKRRGSLVTPF